MRRLVGVLAAALLVVPAGAGIAAPAEEGPGAGTAQAAVSVFLQSDGHRLPVMYFAGAITYDVVDAYGIAGKARCIVKTRKHVMTMICTAVATPVQIPPTDFSMDPLLREAHVAFDQGRWHHSVDWTNDRGFTPDYGTNPGGAGVVAFAEAKSSGTIFNYDFSQQRDHPYALLIETAAARVAANGVHLRTSADGLVHLSVRFPAPQD
jgi:hypothetical protein